MKTLKITACFLLLFQVLHLASLQATTDFPGRTIDKSWLRKPFINTGENGNPEQSEFDSGSDNNGGLASGFMADVTEEEENVANQFRRENETSEDLNISNNTLHSAFENETTQAELPQAIVPPANASTESTNSSQTNMTQAEEEFSSTMTAENSTSTRDLSNNNTALESTTLAPENGTTKQPTTTLDSDKRANSTGSTTTAATTSAAPNATGSTTAALSTAGPNTTTPQTNNTTTTNPFGIPESSLATTTDVVNVPNVANRSGVIADGSERGTGAQSGLESDPYRSKRNVAWLAVLGTAAATACVGVVAYIILKKRNQKAFTHRKLVEEYPADPVLRLDNCEPLDLNFGGAAYNNPGLQRDHIQMDSLSARR
ncbi:mucin-15 [Austrofundulus limnaeus]|uniref:Mucin-15 n=1 Tax=Austrofundulus limnaeus TaxID=52670 RepID=A0A2I4DAS6_AUSLI|nr:PREDICTED: mucin-15 [Austrofundulus limnaeus]